MDNFNVPEDQLNEMEEYIRESSLSISFKITFDLLAGVNWETVIPLDGSKKFDWEWDLVYSLIDNEGTEHRTIQMKCPGKSYKSPSIPTTNGIPGVCLSAKQILNKFGNFILADDAIPSWPDSCLIQSIIDGDILDMKAKYNDSNR